MDSADSSPDPRKSCSVVNQSALQNDPSEGGESWALAILLAAVGSKQPERLDDIEVVFLHREEASFELLAGSYIALANGPKPVEFFSYSATESVTPILSAGMSLRVKLYL